MTFTIIWDRPARFVLFRLPRHVAEKIAAAVIAFAERGEGYVEWESPYHHLRAGAHDALLVIDPEALTVTVIGIHRARP